MRFSRLYGGIAASLLFASSPASAEPVRVIFDTDMATDIDDVMALAMLHALESRGEACLLAVTVSSDDRWSASFVDLINTFYGRPDVPIGIVRDGKTWAAQVPDTVQVSYFTRDMAQAKGADGKQLYPHDLVDGSKAADATALLRTSLAAQPDQSVVMIQVGFSTNLARLLASGPDAAAPLDGRELVRRKVRLLSVMGGYFGQPAAEPVREFNIRVDPPAAQSLFAGWPTPIVASGSELGGAMLFPAARVESDFAYAARHPVADAYRAYDLVVTGSDGKRIVDLHWPHDHAMFDLTSVLYAVRPANDYFTLSAPGRIEIGADGSNRFIPASDGPHRYLTVTPEQKARADEAMIQLTSQPPSPRLTGNC